MGRRPGIKKKVDDTSEAQPIPDMGTDDSTIMMNGRLINRSTRKVAPDESDYIPEQSASKTEIPSTINQRPRRSIKHKFIKCPNEGSANSPQSLQNLDRARESTDLADNYDTNALIMTVSDNNGQESMMQLPGKRGRKKKITSNVVSATVLSTHAAPISYGQSGVGNERTSALSMPPDYHSDNIDEDDVIIPIMVDEDDDGVCVVRDTDEYGVNMADNVIEEIVHDSNEDDVIYMVDTAANESIEHEEQVYAEEIVVGNDVTDEGGAQTNRVIEYAAALASPPFNHAESRDYTCGGGILEQTETVAYIEQQLLEAAAVEEQAASPVVQPRRRGRPRKSKPATESVSAHMQTVSTTTNCGPTDTSHSFVHQNVDIDMCMLNRPAVIVEIDSISRGTTASTEQSSNTAQNISEKVNIAKRSSIIQSDHTAVTVEHASLHTEPDEKNESSQNVVNVFIDSEKVTIRDNEYTNSIAPINGDINLRHQVTNDDIVNAVDLLAFANQNVQRSNCNGAFKSLTEEETRAAVAAFALSAVPSNSNSMSIELVPVQANIADTPPVEVKKSRGRPPKRKTLPDQGKHQGNSTNDLNTSLHSISNAPLAGRTTRRSTRGTTDAAGADKPVSNASKYDVTDMTISNTSPTVNKTDTEAKNAHSEQVVNYDSSVALIDGSIEHMTDIGTNLTGTTPQIDEMPIETVVTEECIESCAAEEVIEEDNINEIVQKFENTEIVAKVDATDLPDKFYGMHIERNASSDVPTDKQISDIEIQQTVSPDMAHSRSFTEDTTDVSEVEAVSSNISGLQAEHEHCEVAERSEAMIDDSQVVHLPSEIIVSGDNQLAVEEVDGQSHANVDEVGPADSAPLQVEEQVVECVTSYDQDDSTSVNVELITETSVSTDSLANRDVAIDDSQPISTHSIIDQPADTQSMASIAPVEVLHSQSVDEPLSNVEDNIEAQSEEQEESCDQDQQQPCANAEAIATASQPGDLYTIAHGTSAGSQAIPFLSEGDINDEAGITVNTSDVVMTDCASAQAEEQKEIVPSCDLESVTIAATIDVSLVGSTLQSEDSQLTNEQTSLDEQSTTTNTNDVQMIGGALVEIKESIESVQTPNETCEVVESKDARDAEELPAASNVSPAIAVEAALNDEQKEHVVQNEQMEIEPAVESAEPQPKSYDVPARAETIEPSSTTTEISNDSSIVNSKSQKNDPSARKSSRSEQRSSKTNASKVTAKPEIIDDNSNLSSPQPSTEQSSTNQTSESQSEETDDTNNRRRSGRIKTIIQSKQRSRGQGVVKDRLSTSSVIVNDDEASNISADFSTPISTIETLPVASVKSEEQLEKERIDRENGMKLFIQIADNEHRSERIISKEAKKMTCDCFLTKQEFERGDLGCGDDCLNRMLLIECGPKCIVGDRCTNKRFQNHSNADCTIFRTEKKGYGLIASSFIPGGTFIMEYVGEVLNSKIFEKRALEYSKLMNVHYYFMALSSDRVIDATRRGNISRFINHSCNPNAETQKWTVNGELRIGFFSTKDIRADEEITFDYQFQRYGKEAQKCFCESYNCRGWIGGEPDEAESCEDDDDDDEESEEESVKTDKEGQLAVDEIPKDEVVDEQKRNKVAKPKTVKDTTKKQVRRERGRRKVQTDKVFKKHLKTTSAEIREDPDLEKEIEVLMRTGLKNQAHTLQLSRLCVRAKLLKAKRELLKLLREGARPCIRLFLDYRGLRLLHPWMGDFTTKDRLTEMKFRLDFLQTMEILPVPNKTTLIDSKIYQGVERWGKESEYKELLKEVLEQSQATQAAVVPPLETSEPPTPIESGSGTPTSSDDIASPKIDDAAVSVPSATAVAVPEAIEVKMEVNEETVTEISSENTQPAAEVSEVIAKEEEPCTPMDTADVIVEPEPLIPVSEIKLELDGEGENNATIEINPDTPKEDEGKVNEADSMANEMNQLVQDVLKTCHKLLVAWEQLPEEFRIPKKQRIEQMKEHEREADQGYKQAMEETTPYNAAFSTRFGEREKERPIEIIDSSSQNNVRDKDPRNRSSRYKTADSNYQKMQRRQMFEARVNYAQEDFDRRKQLDIQVHTARCMFFKLDPRKTAPELVPYCLNETNGQWYGPHMNAIPTPPNQVDRVVPERIYPTDPEEYYLPPINLPDQWKFAITSKGQIYYYHEKLLNVQWNPPEHFAPLISDQPAAANHLHIKSEIDAEDDEPNRSDDDEEELLEINDSAILKNRLNLKSDPDLEDNVEDESSDTDSEDDELEARYTTLLDCTQEYFEYNKKNGNLEQEIAAMAGPNILKNENSANSLLTSDREVATITESKEQQKRKNREKLEEIFRVSPLSNEMRREIRQNARRYKENKAKLSRQKEKMNQEKQRPKKLNKLTDGIPIVSKGESNDSDGKYSFKPIAHYESRKSKISSFDTPTRINNNMKQSSSATVSASATATANITPSPNSLTHLFMSKLPSIGHKFESDTEELLLKHATKPSTSSTLPLPTATSASSSNKAASNSASNNSSSSASTSSSSSSSTSSAKKREADSNSSSSKIPSKRKKSSGSSEKIKDKFRFDISTVIVKALRPYYEKSCEVGRIQSREDFAHLARKLTHFVMLKELKHCANVNNLEASESVKGKAREYIRKYMSKFGAVYARAENEAEFRGDDIMID